MSNYHQEYNDVKNEIILTRLKINNMVKQRRYILMEDIDQHFGNVKHLDMPSQRVEYLSNNLKIYMGQMGIIHQYLEDTIDDVNDPHFKYYVKRMGEFMGGINERLDILCQEGDKISKVECMREQQVNQIDALTDHVELKHQKDIQILSRIESMAIEKLNQAKEDIAAVERELSDSNINFDPMDSLNSDLDDFKKRYNDLQTKVNSIKNRLAFYETNTKKPVTLKGGPTGDITIVFTDVMGSTALWEHNVQMMGDSISIHNNLIRTLIEKYNGYEVKTEGDAFMCSFKNVRDAVSFSISSQMKLLDQPWPNELMALDDGKVIHDINDKIIYRGLRVRIGLHKGSPISKPDPITNRMDYFGPMVNKAARVSGSAQGGQILVSDDVWKSIEPFVKKKWDGIPIVARSEGKMKFKGIEQPEHVHSIIPRELSNRKWEKTIEICYKDQFKLIKVEYDKLMKRHRRLKKRSNITYITLLVENVIQKKDRLTSDICKSLNIDGGARKEDIKRIIERYIVDMKRHLDQFKKKHEIATTIQRLMKTQMKTIRADIEKLPDEVSITRKRRKPRPRSIRQSKSMGSALVHTKSKGTEKKDVTLPSLFTTPSQMNNNHMSLNVRQIDISSCRTPSSP
jgi:class 3 adenylate cyclase